ncbi:MAG: DNA replication/repair protein RecF [Hyphomicrobiaceae bacterium]
MSGASAQRSQNDAGTGSVSTTAPNDRLWIGRIAITDFRSYAAAAIDTGPEPVVLIGQNGAGKTNLLEAISLLAPGSGLRRAGYDELARIGGGGGWAVAARVNSREGPVDIGTGQRTDSRPEGGRSGRVVRINGESASTGALADLVDVVWLTPTMDGLFTGPAADRRQFLDRLVLCFDPGHAARSARFERAMRQRNRALEDDASDVTLLDGLEIQMAETGVSIAAARMEAVAALEAMGRDRRARDQASPFPWFEVTLDGTLEDELRSSAAVEIEDRYRERLRQARGRDRAAGRTLEGPHRSDLLVTHGPKSMPARLGSTGEQKALLAGLVLSHAALIGERRTGGAPILLLDEVAAHFDDLRRAALFEEILALQAQAWMTGTERAAFSGLAGKAFFARIEAGRATVD